MSRTSRRTRRPPGPSSFRCVDFRLDVPTDAPGTEHRNHCRLPLVPPRRRPAGRPRHARDCGSGMEPIAITVRGKGEWVLIHRCSGCGELHANRSAADDSPLLLLRLAVKPLALPPFPLDLLSLV